MISSKLDVRSLRKLSSLSSLPPTALEKIATNLTVKAVKQKTKIFDQGDAADMGYLLLSGVVRLSWVNQAHRRVLITPLSKGDFFGVGSLFPDARHPYQCEAITDCTIGLIRPEKLIDALMGISFQSYLRGTKILNTRVWETFLRCIRGMRIPLRKRLALELLDLGASFGIQDSRGTILAVRITHEELADSIGFSRQKVTQTLADFERQQVVIRDGRRLILNVQRLRELLERQSPRRERRADRIS